MNCQKGTQPCPHWLVHSVAPLSAATIVQREPVGSSLQIFRSTISHDVAVVTAEAGHVSWRWITDALEVVFCQSLQLLPANCQSAVQLNVPTCFLRSFVGQMTEKRQISLMSFVFRILYSHPMTLHIYSIRSSRYDNSVIIYSTSCQSKPVWLPFFCLAECSCWSFPYNQP